MSAGTIETNWSGNYTYRAHAIHHPTGLDELRGLLTGRDRARVLGSRHSFTAIADAPELISLDRMPGEITVDRAASTVSLPGHVTYAELAEVLNRDGVALASMASLPHISVAGAIATATHGSGDERGNLATAVTELELVTPEGEVITTRRGEPDFDGLVVGLGALGAVTRVTLTVEPYYEMSQRVFTGLSWEALAEYYDAITAAGDSVSVFHLFGERTEQLWIKRRVDRDQPGDADEPEALFDAAPAAAACHPVLGADPINCTAQLGAVGPWSERLPHFRSGFTPSSGEEIQSEFFVARPDAMATLAAVRELAAEIRPLLLTSELRTIAADTLWLSPQYGRPTTAIHFTWRRRQSEVEQVVARIEAALAPFAARPHWGKLFGARAETLAPLYPRIEDFRRLRARLDPRGVLVNDWLRDRVLGA